MDIQKLRKQLDGLSQVVDRLRPIKGFDVSASVEDINSGKNLFEINGIPYQQNSEPIKEAKQSLLFAKAWVGKLVDSLEVPTSHNNEKGRNEDIEPIDTKVDIAAWEEKMQWSSKNHIEKVDFLRGRIKELVKEVKEFSDSLSRSGAIARTQIEIYLEEATINLGFELERVRNEE